MKIDLEKLMQEIMNEIPEYTIPEPYVRQLIEENIDCFDTRAEVLAETKMQLTEESGMDFMLSREEAEDYLCDEFSDEKWAEVSKDGRVSSRLLRAMEEDEDSTLFELMKNMPMIPVAKLISSMIMKHLELNGVDTDSVDAELLCMSVIEDLNTSLSELNGEFEDGFEDEEDDDEDDVFEKLGLEFEMEDDLPFGTGSAGTDDMKIIRGRRSRITRFPGKK